MRVYAKTNRVLFSKATIHGWDVCKTRSRSNPNKFYTIDLTHGRCSCPAWIFQKGGERKPCKHLRALGFQQTYFKPGEIELAEPKKLTAAELATVPVVETE